MKQERDGGTGLDESSWLGLLVSIPLHVGELRAQGTAQETAVAEWSVSKHTYTQGYIMVITFSWQEKNPKHLVILVLQT